MTENLNSSAQTHVGPEAIRVKRFPIDIRVLPERLSETKRDEARRNETKRDETRRNETKRDETRPNEAKRDEAIFSLFPYLNNLQT